MLQPDRWGVLDTNVSRFDSRCRNNIERLDFLLKSGRSISTILELGSGYGYWCIEITKNFKQKKTIFCLDNDLRKLSELPRRITSHHYIKPLLVDINQTIPIKSHSIDLVIISYMAQYINLPSLFLDCFGLLKPEATILLVDWKSILEKQDTAIIKEHSTTVFETDLTIGIWITIPNLC